MAAIAEWNHTVPTSPTYNTISWLGWSARIEREPFCAGASDGRPDHWWIKEVDRYHSRFWFSNEDPQTHWVNVLIIHRSFPCDVSYAECELNYLCHPKEKWRDYCGWTSVCWVRGMNYWGTRRLFVNALPEDVLRYFSNCSALFLLSKTRYVRIFHGLNWLVCFDLPALCCFILRVRFLVNPR